VVSGAFMIDTEVERLRRLRASALRLRAVARALAETKGMTHDPLLYRGACAAWRVVRMVSGRLRAHPFADYQRDAGLGTLLGNSVAAFAASVGASNRIQALKAFETHLKAVSHQLDDARALAWAADLSDALGRSQLEIRSLAAAAEYALFDACEAYAQRGGAPSATLRVSKVSAAKMPSASLRSRRVTSAASAAGSDWPYLAL
jgi:hypothetical protein